MSGNGYTPLFASLTTGTLCGKWPDIGLWPIVLSLADKNGVVDVTHQYISTVTGLPLQEVIACMRRFCEPDEGSRSPAEAGARLLPLEERRDWGWQIVNHAAYRERARLMAKSAREVDSGTNKVRMKDRPPATAEDRRPPPKTAADPLSNANANTEKRARSKRASRVPADFQPDLEYARAQLPDIDAERESQRFRDWEFKTPRSDWDAVWRNWIGNCRDSGKYAKRAKGGGNGLPILNA